MTDSDSVTSFVTSLLLLVASRVGSTTATLKVALPTVLSGDELTRYEAAIRLACTRASRFSTCRFGLSSVVSAVDNGRHVAAAHSLQMRPQGIPIVLVCDLNEAVLSLTVATFDPRIEAADRTRSNVVLARDSVRFGTDTLLRYVLHKTRCALSGSAGGLRDGLIEDSVLWERLKNRVGRQGLAGHFQSDTIARDVQDQLGRMVVTYVDLIAEYASRVVAATIRNPFRLGGAIRMMLDPAAPADSVPASESGQLFQHRGVAWTGVNPIDIDIVATGSGWRLLGLAPDAPSQPDNDVVQFISRLVRRVSERVVALCQASLEDEDDPARRALGELKQPKVSFHLGMRRTGPLGERVLEEALADALVVYGPKGPNDVDAASREWSTPIGFDGRVRTFEDVLSGGAGTATAWYAFLGDRQVVCPGSGDAAARIVRDMVPSPVDGSSWEPLLSPAFPEELTRECDQLGVRLAPDSVADLARGSSFDIAASDRTGSHGEPYFRQFYENWLARQFIG